MGLDAEVYVNIKNFRVIEGTGEPKVEKDTGEVYFENEEFAAQYSKDAFVDVRYRLGNITEVGMVRNIVADILPEGSILRQKVLYSGSHGGDFIRIDLLDALEQEIGNVKDMNLADEYLDVFLEKMSALAAAARRQNNPIVFV